MSSLRRVTFSGIDQWTKPSDAASLYQMFSFIEFAFLFTDNRKAGNRYPMPVMLKAYKSLGIPMAIHLCGKLAHNYIKTGDLSPVIDMLGDSMDLFDRIQLNVPKTSHFCRTIEFPSDKKIIIQLHEGTQALLSHYMTNPNVQGFQDASGGHGIVCTNWQYPETEFFGYAGGIGPDNAAACVKAIDEICPTEFWIDMESSIRTNDRFDIQKCRAVCASLRDANLI
ncbi:MAG: hypothetical protein IJC48_07085 [Clostridia bacterium]|nr:hypothetical protein [Clostridia bacterium]MBQ4157836.1 hypothetical protein [Clostridia bacterium]